MLCGRNALTERLHASLAAKVIAAKEHKKHKEVSGFARENSSFLEIFVFLCGYRFS